METHGVRRWGQVALGQASRCGGLQELGLNEGNCSSLEALPPSVGELGSLQELILEGCSAFGGLPDTLGGLSLSKSWKYGSARA